MGRELADAYPECQALFDRADEVLGYGLSKICFDGPLEELTRSSNCQPAIFVTSMVCIKALELAGVKPEFRAAAGLSLGEWSALCYAGALSFEDTVRALEARGRFMQEACEQSDGAMVSVLGMDREPVEAICEEAGVQLANINSPGQLVLSGERAGIEKADTLAQEAGARKTVVLNVAGAFHSRLMQPAADRLAEFLEDVPFTEPSMPVLSNVTGEPHASAEAMQTNMVAQVTSPVQWVSDVEWMRANGSESFIEFGPGRVLSGLIKRIDRASGLHNVEDAASLEITVSAFSEASQE